MTALSGTTRSAALLGVEARTSAAYSASAFRRVRDRHPPRWESPRQTPRAPHVRHQTLPSPPNFLRRVSAPIPGCSHGSALKVESAVKYRAPLCSPAPPRTNRTSTPPHRFFKMRRKSVGRRLTTRNKTNGLGHPELLRLRAASNNPSASNCRRSFASRRQRSRPHHGDLIHIQRNRP